VANWEGPPTCGGSTGHRREKERLKKPLPHTPRLGTIVFKKSTGAGEFRSTRGGRSLEHKFAWGGRGEMTDASLPERTRLIKKGLQSKRQRPTKIPSVAEKRKESQNSNSPGSSIQDGFAFKQSVSGKQKPRSIEPGGKRRYGLPCPLTHGKGKGK